MVWSEKAGMQAFFSIIKNAYHTDNPYHNFYHAIHVVQARQWGGGRLTFLTFSPHALFLLSHRFPINVTNQW